MKQGVTMRVRDIPLGAGAIALGLLILVLSPRSIATARRPTGPAGFIATDPDFPIWEWHGINACNEMHADVVYNWSQDEYLVVFDWDLNDTGDHDIMAVTVSADGQAAMSPFSVAYDAAYDDSHPAIARNPYGDNYLVVWQRRVGSGDYNIYGKIITHSYGAGTEFLIAGYLDDQLYPDVAYATASHHYLVVWEDHDSTLTAPPDVRGRCVDQDGTLLPVLDVGSASAGQYSPSLATNAFNYHWLVAWKDMGSGEADIYGREVSSVGSCSLPSTDFVISDQAGYSYDAPAVGWAQVDPLVSAYGEFLVVWPESGNMLAQRVEGEDYSLLGDLITVSDFDSSKYEPAVVFATERKEWWVVWEDDRYFG